MTSDEPVFAGPRPVRVRAAAAAGAVAALCLAPSPAAGAPPARMESAADLAASIHSKLGYDLSYFSNVLALRARGRTLGGVPPGVFAREAARAATNLPVLRKYEAEKTAPPAGGYFTLPHSDERHRVYTNLLAILNLSIAYDARDFGAAIAYGRRVQVTDKQALGQVRGDDPDYYVTLYREFFFLMAAACFRAGQDADAVRWLARVEADADLQRLKARIASEPKPETETRDDRLEALRRRPVAVLPFDTAAQDAGRAWMREGLAEVLGADLVQHTDLVLVERAQLGNALLETKLAQLGFTDDRATAALGRLVRAGTLVAGAVLPEGDSLRLSLRLLDAEQATVLAAATRPTTDERLLADLREAALELLGAASFVDPDAAEALRASRVPGTGTVRDLMKARVLAATRSAEAKALYAKAVREDPACARLFDDLQREFSDVSATVAVLPFANVTGAPEDAWMGRGAAEALSSDLPKMRFTVVERAQLRELLETAAVGEIVDAGGARELGRRAGADFTVVGSILRQKPQIRVDARFVEVRTGAVLFGVSVQDARDDFMAALAALSGEIARHLNEPLAEETLAQLAARKTSPAELERFARQELARESLAREARAGQIREREARELEARVREEAARLARAPAPAPPAPPRRSRTPFWLAVGATAAGTALAATGFLVSDGHGDEAGYNEALRRVATATDLQQSFADARDAELRRAGIWSAVGFAGVALSALGLGRVVWDELVDPQRKEVPAAPVLPEVSHVPAP